MKHVLVTENTGEEVQFGQRFLTFRGELVELLGCREPHKPSSSGHVFVRFADGNTREFYPSVIRCKFVQK